MLGATDVIGPPRGGRQRRGAGAPGAAAAPSPARRGPAGRPGGPGRRRSGSQSGRVGRSGARGRGPAGPARRWSEHGPSKPGRTGRRWARCAPGPPVRPGRHGAPPCPGRTAVASACVKVSTRGDYASRALLSLALHGGQTIPTSVRDIAERTGLPQPYLEQILLALKGAGLVRSKRGVGGGYVLARAPEDDHPGPDRLGRRRPHRGRRLRRAPRRRRLRPRGPVRAAGRVGRGRRDHARRTSQSFTLADMVARARPAVRRRAAAPRGRRPRSDRRQRLRFQRSITGTSRSQPSTLSDAGAERPAAGRRPAAARPSGRPAPAARGRGRSTAVSPSGGPGPLDHPVGPAAHVGGRLAVRHAVGPQRPARPLHADLGGGQALVVAVVPLDEVVGDLGPVAEPGQPAGLERPGTAGSSAPGRSRWPASSVPSALGLGLARLGRAAGRSGRCAGRTGSTRSRRGGPGPAARPAASSAVELDRSSSRRRRPATRPADQRQRRRRMECSDPGTALNSRDTNEVGLTAQPGSSDSVNRGRTDGPVRSDERR